MNFVVVDNNKSDLDALAKAISAAVPECHVQLFTDPLLSAKYICNNLVDAAFLADRMCPVDGFILMRSLRKNKPVLPIVILCKSEQDKSNAIHAGADGYLRKPVSANLLERVVKQVIA